MHRQTKHHRGMQCLVLLVFALAWVLPERSPAPVPAEYAWARAWGCPPRGLTLRVPIRMRGGAGDEGDQDPGTGGGVEVVEEGQGEVGQERGALEEEAEEAEEESWSVPHDIQDPTLLEAIMDSWPNISLPGAHIEDSTPELDISSSQPEDATSRGGLSRDPRHGMARPLLATMLHSADFPTVASL